MEKIRFCPDDGEAVDFYVLEQTRLGGVDYILVTDGGEEGEALILKDLSAQDEGEGIYEIVDDDRELQAVMEIFEQLLQDTDITLE